MMFIPYNNQKGQLAIAKVVPIDNSIYQFSNIVMMPIRLICKEIAINSTTKGCYFPI